MGTYLLEKMFLEKVFKNIEDRYIRILDLAPEETSYQYRINHDNYEITFYHVLWESNLESFKSQVKEANQEIFKYVQSNYFYKVIQMRGETNDKFKEHEMAVYINRIQLTKIDKSPKTAHLAQLKTLKDFYV